MRFRLLSILVLTLVPLTACNLYFSGGDDPDPCEDGDWGGAGLAEPPPLLRNPQSGGCESFGWGEPPYPCDGVCGPCAGDGSQPPGSTEPVNPSETDPDGSGGGDSSADRASEAPGANPSWGYCESYCTGLDENSCLATDGCRGIYDSDGNAGAGEFQECWQMDFAGPALYESCEGLDAYSCSMSDQCIAVHEFLCGDVDGQQEEPGLIPPECSPGFFLSCHDEVSDAQGCYGDEECGEGFSCNAAEVCLPPPGGDGDWCPDCGVPTVCYGFCVPDAVDPGECDGEVLCDALPPLCEAGSTPGIANGCYTGQCIDLSLCPQASCVDIVGESMCIARDDCSPYYVGVDCSCTPEGCDCGDWNFDSCNEL